MRGPAPAGEGLEGDRLFEALARGEPNALDEVCRRYGERVARIVRRNLGPALRAHLETDDLSQEVMLDVIRRAKRVRFDSEWAFLQWLGLVVEQQVIRAARYWQAAKRWNGNEVPLGKGPYPADPLAERPSRLFGKKEAADRLTLALVEMPPSDREVLIARLLLDLPWSAVATSLGTTREAAEMRFLRARRRLAEKLRWQSF